MITYKSGLFNGLPLNKDIPIARYKPYVYTTKDFNELQKYSKIPGLYLELNSNLVVKIKNCKLSINSIEYDITDWRIKDVVSVLQESGIIVNLISGFENVQYLPAIMLSDCNNTQVHQLKGEISPFPLREYLKDNPTVYSSEREILSISVFDMVRNKTISHTENEDNGDIFYNTAGDISVVVKTIDTVFFLYLDYDTKFSTNGHGVANILRYEISKIDDLPILIPTEY